jgi:hypothetical protein
LPIRFLERRVKQWNIVELKAKTLGISAQIVKTGQQLQALMTLATQNLQVENFVMNVWAKKDKEIVLKRTSF